MSRDFEARLLPDLERIAAHFGTPFHIYDEAGILDTGERLKLAFSRVKGFREYFAVKALPNPRILQLMKVMGFGFDCASIPELMLARGQGARAGDIMFTSNNTSAAEFDEAIDGGGCILNLDDISLIDKVPEMPELVCFRLNPGPEVAGNKIIGEPEKAKFGLTVDQYVDAYRTARERGASRFGLHTMVVSNQRDYRHILDTTRRMLLWAGKLDDVLGIQPEFINIGGGFGIPYGPAETPLDIAALGEGVADAVDQFAARRGYRPKIYTESGRYITGPHGVLVTRAINRKETYRIYVGADACMSALMRPGMYPDTYHHISVPGRTPEDGVECVDVTGSLCENNDKFAVQRTLPRIEDGDLLVIHDTGAHGHSMGFTYNGRLRPKELLLRSTGSVEVIRRAETPDDYFATLQFDPWILSKA